MTQAADSDCDCLKHLKRFMAKAIVWLKQNSFKTVLKLFYFSFISIVRTVYNTAWLPCESVLKGGVGVCRETWTNLGQGYIRNATRVHETTLLSCQSLCINNSSCNAIDWNNNAQYTCRLHGPWSAGLPIINHVAWTHYQLNRYNCTSKRRTRFIHFFYFIHWIA